jgi:hypothetical protein
MKAFNGLMQRQLRSLVEASLAQLVDFFERYKVLSQTVRHQPTPIVPHPPARRNLTLR